MEYSTEKTLKIIYQRIRANSSSKLESNELAFEPLPQSGEMRWGISLVLQGKLPNDVFNKLEEVSNLIGNKHTFYDANSIHLTIRSLEAYRENILPNDECLTIYRNMMQDYLGKNFTVSFKGIISTASGLLLCGYPEFDLAEMRTTIYDKLNMKGLTLISPEPNRDKLRNTCHASLVLYGSQIVNNSEYINFLNENVELDFGVSVNLNLKLVKYSRTANQVKVIQIS